MTEHANLILIGMPGSGKSTIGVLLAKRLGMGFIDTDLVIQQSQRQSLQGIIEQRGYRTLRALEESTLLSLAPVQHVIATGGSAVYSQAGLQHLKTLGRLIYLQLDLDTLQKRVGDFSQRGIASDPEHTFADIYRERCPLYERVADIVIDCKHLNSEQVVDRIIEKLQG